MTRKLFWDDPYLTSIETAITAVNGDLVSLRETIFYPFSGGQEADAGSIGAHPVLEVLKSDLELQYRLPADHNLQAGGGVSVTIDWDRRYRLMRLHFAAELILELVYRALPKVEKIGAHIGPDKARIDFFWPENISFLFPRLLVQARQLVGQNILIISDFDDDISQRRYWEVPGFARVSCGGTHLQRTGEVGHLRLKRKNIGKHKERIDVFVSDA